MDFVWQVKNSKFWISVLIFLTPLIVCFLFFVYSLYLLNSDLISFQVLNAGCLSAAWTTRNQNLHFSERNIRLTTEHHILAHLCKTAVLVNEKKKKTRSTAFLAPLIIVIKIRIFFCTNKKRMK